MFYAKIRDMDQPIPFPDNNILAGAQPICPQCHLPVRPEYYFCPNCGQKLHVPPLSTSATSQVLLYLFSAVLPFIAYLAIMKWQGVSYIRSSDPRARTIGWIALGILVVSSVLVFWWTTMWVNQQISAALNDVGNYGTFNAGL